MVTTALAPGQGVFAFSGSGLLLPYYLGIMYTLNATAYIAPGVTPTAGISGGALTTFAACAGISMPQLSAYLQQQLEEHPLDFWAVRPDVLLGLAEMSDPQTFQRCSAKVRAAISRLDPGSPTLNASSSWLVDSFSSNTDYWGAVTASSTISCASSDPQARPANGGPTFWEYRGQPSMDGAYANDLTTLCAALGQPYGAPGSTCVSVASYEPGAFRKDGVATVDCADAATTTSTTTTTATSSSSTTTTTTTTSRTQTTTSTARGSPRADATTPSAPSGSIGRRALRAAVIILGTTSGSATSNTTQLPTNCSAFPGGAGLPPFKPASDPAGPWPSICPGCDPRNPLPFTRQEWQTMSMDGALAMANWELLFAYGRADAQLWVANQTQAMVGALQGGSQRVAEVKQAPLVHAH